MRDLMKNLILLFALVITYFLSSGAKANELSSVTLSESNTVVLRGPVTSASVAVLSAEITNLHIKLAKNKVIILFLDTPGGSIAAGNQLIELIQGLDRKVVTVTSFAASMGYQIAQALGTRYILQSGTLMSHRASIGGLSGQVPGEANTRLQYITELVEEMEKKTSKRVGMTLAAYKEAIRDELWVTGQNAVDKKHADQVVKAKCDASLMGTVEISVETMFGPVTAEVNKCPIVSGPVSVKFDRALHSNPFIRQNIRREIDGYFSKTKGIWTY